MTNKNLVDIVYNFTPEEFYNLISTQQVTESLNFLIEPFCEYVSRELQTIITMPDKFRKDLEYFLTFSNLSIPDKQFLLLSLLNLESLNKPKTLFMLKPTMDINTIIGEYLIIFCGNGVYEEFIPHFKSIIKRLDLGILLRGTGSKSLKFLTELYDNPTTRTKFINESFDLTVKDLTFNLSDRVTQFDDENLKKNIVIKSSFIIPIEPNTEYLSILKEKSDIIFKLFEQNKHLVYIKFIYPNSVDMRCQVYNKKSYLDFLTYIEGQVLANV